MEIKINSLTQTMYQKLVEYMRDAEEIWIGSGRKTIYNISSIGKVNGNPPCYTDVTINVQEIAVEDKSQKRNKIRESVKGLIDLLFSEKSLDDSVPTQDS